MAELYARKLRQKIFEGKRTFSNANSFIPIYQEIEKQMGDRHAALASITEIDRNEEKLKKTQQLILQEIEKLSDYCKFCKPQKKKKA